MNPHDWQRNMNAQGGYVLSMSCKACGRLWLPYESEPKDECRFAVDEGRGHE